MSGWHNTEYLSMPFRSRVNLYGRKPSWWSIFEPHSHLCILFPVTFAYIESELNTSDRRRRVAVLAIGFTEQVVNCFWGWVDSCRYGLHYFAHRNTAPSFMAPADQVEFRGRMFRLSRELVGKFHELGLEWLLSGSGINAAVGHQALCRMERYFHHHPDAVWVAYDWHQDRFPDERGLEGEYTEEIQAGTSWGQLQGSIFPYEDPRVKRRRTDDGWATALTVARGTPRSSRNAALAPVTGSHQAGPSTAVPLPLSSRSVPGAGRRASTGGATALVPLRIRLTPPRVGAKSPIAVPPRNRLGSPKRKSLPEEVEADVIQQNVPITPWVTPSTGREPSTEDAVTPQFAPPLVPDVVTLPLK